MDRALNVSFDLYQFPLVPYLPCRSSHILDLALLHPHGGVYDIPLHFTFSISDISRGLVNEHPGETVLMPLLCARDVSRSVLASKALSSQFEKVSSWIGSFNPETMKHSLCSSFLYVGP